MANGSRVVRMDPLLGYPPTKIVKRKSIFSDRPVSALNNTSYDITIKPQHYQNIHHAIIMSPWFAETSRIRGPFPFEVSNLVSFEVYKYWYLFSLKLQENVEQRGVNVTHLSVLISAFAIRSL